MESRSSSGRLLQDAATSSSKAIRILILVSKSSPYWTQAMSATADIIPIALRILEERKIIEEAEDCSKSTRILAKEDWGIRRHICFDIQNDSYDVMLAHLPEHNCLPVAMVWLSGKGETARIADAGGQKRVNQEIGDLHNRNGFDVMPPYVHDFTASVPHYLYPRDFSLLHRNRHPERPTQNLQKQE